MLMSFETTQMCYNDWDTKRQGGLRLCNERQAHSLRTSGRSMSSTATRVSTTPRPSNEHRISSHLALKVKDTKSETTSYRGRRYMGKNSPSVRCTLCLLLNPVLKLRDIPRLSWIPIAIIWGSFFSIMRPVSRLRDVESSAPSRATLTRRHAS